jgi:hypothetical protein
MVDKFRDSGRPLLSVMADPESVFIRALGQFKHRSLYANAVNDRTVTYFTAGISGTDPFVDMDAVTCRYIAGYEPVIMDGEDPVDLKDQEPQELALTQRWARTTGTILRRIPIAAFLVIFVPVGTTIFLANSVIQSLRSYRRIRLHEEGKAGINIHDYRIPLISGMRQEVEDLYENMNNAQEQEYLAEDDEGARAQNQASPADSVEEVKARQKPVFPTLALTSEQFAAIEALDKVGFKKYPVYIHKHRHSHAAIIRRRTGAAFDEGRVVVKHWLDEFEL